ncbi:unnamed protein product [Calicophoron daubneyi]|uniref:Hemerythrin-like domain-containing protein n=1 Tax=Calicophoron daubneyi TaxID=300641 RepID=A0AAV2TQB8_CALDB
MIMSESFNSQIHMERAALLQEGAMLLETILKVPHETSEEISKILKDVHDSHLKIENAYLSTFGNLISPILDDFVAATERSAMRELTNSVVVNMRRSFHEYARLVQPYKQALESLADHLDI